MALALTDEGGWRRTFGLTAVLPHSAPSVTGQHSDWDVNKDGQVNVLDLILIGQHFGETGAPGWVVADVKKDGVINVLDMILVGQHWS